MSDMNGDGEWLIEARNITKRFGHITALDGVDFAAALGKSLAWWVTTGPGNQP